MSKSKNINRTNNPTINKMVNGTEKPAKED